MIYKRTKTYQKKKELKEILDCFKKRRKEFLNSTSDLK